MALSDKEISALYFEALGSKRLREQDRKMVTRFAHTVESEVRKQDEALILMLVERLERADKISGYPNNKAAIKAGRAWLEKHESY